MARACIAALLTTLACACSAADPTAEAEDDLKARSYAYVDTHPETPLGAMARDKIQAALAKIERVAKRGESPLRRALAAETLARVESGDVQLGSIAGARGIDRWHMCKDYALHACDGPPPSPDDRTWRGDDEVDRKLDSALAGYMWGNRLYFTLKRSTDPNELAATLVHEINHVANRSECHYYRNIDTHEVEPDLAFVDARRCLHHHLQSPGSRRPRRNPRPPRQAESPAQRGSDRVVVYRGVMVTWLTRVNGPIVNFQSD